MRLLDANAHAALQRFLDRKLESLPNGSQAQATMLGTWLLDLHLQKINAKVIEIRQKTRTASNNIAAAGNATSTKPTANASPEPTPSTPEEEPKNDGSGEAGTADEPTAPKKRDVKDHSEPNQTPASTGTQ